MFFTVHFMLPSIPGAFAGCFYWHSLPKGEGMKNFAYGILTVLVVFINGCTPSSESPEMTGKWESLDSSGLKEVRSLIHIPETRSILAGGLAEVNMSGISMYDLSQSNWLSSPENIPFNQQVSWLFSRDNSVWASFFMSPEQPGTLRISHDNGKTFMEEIVLPENIDPRCFLVDGTGNQVILLGSVNDGLLISEDGGESWRLPASAISDPGIQCLARNTNRPDHILAGARTGLWESLDGGENWSSITSRIHPLNVFIVDVMAHPLKEDCFVCIYRNNVAEASIVITTDGASTWTPIRQGFYPDAQPRCIAFHPSNPDIMFSGTVMDGVYRTDTLGDTWFPINNGLPLEDNLVIVHRLTAVQGDTPVLYAGLNTEGLVYKLDL
jgi:hypothetical protein